MNATDEILLTNTSKIGKLHTYRGFGFEQIDHVIMEKMPADPAPVNALGKKLITAKP